MKPSLLPGPRQHLRAAVTIPPSKSLTNRALIAASVAGGGTIVSPLDCEDTRLLAMALAAAGWNVNWNRCIEIGEWSQPANRAILNLGNSGTGARLLLSLLASVPGRFVIDGTDRLRERPMAPLLSSLETLGAHLSSAHGFLPVKVDGTVLEGGLAIIRPEVSSQFVSSLVLAAPLMRRGLELTVEGRLPSAPYLDLTADVLQAFGAELEVSQDRRRWRVAPRSLDQTQYEVEGDWSAVAFALAAQAVAGGEIEVGPVDSQSRQGDRAITEILGRAGIHFQYVGDRLRVRGSISRPLEVNLEDSPDLFPALIVVGATAPPGSVFTGLDHLKHKESDRLAVMVANLGSLGAVLIEEGSRLKVDSPINRSQGPPPKVTAAGDHRIAMAMAVAALACGPLELDDSSCVAKSFPDFWEMWERLLGPNGNPGTNP